MVYYGMILLSVNFILGDYTLKKVANYNCLVFGFNLRVFSSSVHRCRNYDFTNGVCTPKLVISYEWYARWGTEWCYTNTSHIPNLAYSILLTSCCAFRFEKGKWSTNCTQRRLSPWREKQHHLIWWFLIGKLCPLQHLRKHQKGIDRKLILDRKGVTFK